jgi:hypothetical protein
MSTKFGSRETRTRAPPGGRLRRHRDYRFAIDVLALIVVHVCDFVLRSLLMSAGEPLTWPLSYLA